MPPALAHSVGSGAQPHTRNERPAAHQPPLRLHNMKDTTGENEHKRRGRRRSDAFEIGVIRVFSRPGPDARDRLRRIMTLMIKHATRDRQSAHGEDTPPSDPQAEDHAEADD